MQNETPKTNRRVRFVQWMSDHSEGLVMGTIVVGFAGLCVAAGVAEVKAANEAQQKANEINDWIRDEFNTGHNVYQLDSGAYLSVDRTSSQEIYHHV